MNTVQTRTLAVLVTAASAIAIAGCGGSSSSGGGASPSPVAAATPSAAASAPAGPPAVLIKTYTATVAGTSETILADVAGATLYYRTSDTSTSVCSGACAAVWPPLLLARGTPASSSTLSGTLSLLVDGNGNQVTYNGHPLYRYSNDTGPGDTKGEGLGGVWHVATPALT
jgi:predicted lipoprotein with Yx(FWY)xxD motif